MKHQFVFSKGVFVIIFVFSLIIKHLITTNELKVKAWRKLNRLILSVLISTEM